MQTPSVLVKYAKFEGLIANSTLSTIFKATRGDYGLFLKKGASPLWAMVGLQSVRKNTSSKGQTLLNMTAWIYFQVGLNLT